ncbi:hypothetical protein LSAT2_031315 [Lamellibrachia satsuma]|nr:hypothetical protein LSAT2_031315 [Lamellibrachia satsuma]
MSKKHLQQLAVLEAILKYISSGLKWMKWTVPNSKYVGTYTLRWSAPQSGSQPKEESSLGLLSLVGTSC